MAYIVTESCIKCKYTECVKNCPVICFHEGANMLVIDPDDCIDCGACVDPCPVHAIYPEKEVPEKWKHYIELNAKYSKIWPEITIPKKPLPDADKFAKLDNKFNLFDPSPGEGDPKII